MFFTSQAYSLNLINQSTIDQKFFQIVSNYSKQYPFKWDFFVKKVICNKQITFFKDTTGIIQVASINYKKLSFVFEIFRLLLKGEIASKIIYKKEFMIIHFNQNFHMEYLTNYAFLISLNLYNYLLSIKEEDTKVYYGAILSYKQKKHLIAIVIVKNNHIYLFNNEGLNYDLASELTFVYLYDFLNSHIESIDNLCKFHLSYSCENYLDQLKKLMVDPLTS